MTTEPDATPHHRDDPEVDRTEPDDSREDDILWPLIMSVMWMT